MAIDPVTLFPGKIDPADAEYPFGKARNITTPGDGTGTPFVANLVNDMFGLFQALLTNTGVIPSGVPDTVLVSQYYTALEEFIKSSDFIDFVGRFNVGDGGTATNSSDPMVNVNRNVDNTALTGNAHCFSDSSTVDRTGTVAYGSYDARFHVNGSEDYNHFAPFQNGMVYNSSGNVGIMYGFIDVPRCDQGTVGVRYGVKLNDVPLTGGATINANHGLYIEELTAGTTQNFAVVTKGATKSVFEGEVIFQGSIDVTPKITAAACTVTGNLQVDQTITAVKLTSFIGGGWGIDGNATSGMRVSAGVGSSHDFILLNQAQSQIIMSVPTGTDSMKFEGNVSFNGAAPAAKPTVSGSRGGNAALASLLTALEAYGLITDSST